MQEFPSRELIGHEGIRGYCFSDDGRFLATTAASGHLRVWSLPVFEQMADIPLGVELHAGVSFSSDGRFVIAASKEAIFLAEVASGTVVQQWQVPHQGWRAFVGASTAKTVVAAVTFDDQGCCDRYDLFHRGVLAPVHSVELNEMALRVFSNSEGGLFLESYLFDEGGSAEFRKWRLRNLVLNELLVDMDLVDARIVGGVPLTSPCRNFLALGNWCYRSAVRWQTLNGSRIIATLPFRHGTTPHIAFSSDDRSVAVAWADLQRLLYVAVFDAHTGVQRWHRDFDEVAFRGIALSAGGGILAVSGGTKRQLVFYHGMTGEHVTTMPRRGVGGFSPDGRFFLSVASNIMLIDLAGLNS